GRTRVRAADARRRLGRGGGSWFGPASSGPWAARQIVETAPATYWLATVRPDGRPPVMPILARRDGISASPESRAPRRRSRPGSMAIDRARELARAKASAT